MLDWLKDEVFTPYPELMVFITVACGFALGRLRYRAIALGAVTGCLVAGLLVGQFEVEVTGPLKSWAFIMFLFALGYRVGPQFFRGLRSDGLPQAGVTIVVCVTGLLVCWGFAEMLGYDVGLGAGLLGGALTQSAVIGVAGDAIQQIPGLSGHDKTEQANLVAVGYAVCYPLGTIFCAILLANVAPKLFRVDLVAECKEMERRLRTDDEDPDHGPGYYSLVLRAYRITDQDVAGRTIGQFEDGNAAQGRRIYITRMRRDGEIFPHTQDTTLRVGDVVAVSAFRGDLVSYDPGHIGPEVDDPALMAYETETMHVVVSNKDAVGRTLGEFRRDPEAVGVFVTNLIRDGVDLPYGPSTKVGRGDTLVLTGPKRLVEPAAAALGRKVPTSYQTDMIWVGLGIFLGGLIGIPALHLGDVPISLSTSGGALIMGLVFGYIRARYPTFGNVPPGAQWFMDTMGLCLFVAIVGINAGPGFVDGLDEAGWQLLVFGAVATVIPLLVGLVVGRYVFRIEVPILLGVIAGAQTTTAAIGAVTEAGQSKIPSLGYTIPYAVGNVLLTIWGAVIVILMQ